MSRADGGGGRDVRRKELCLDPQNQQKRLGKVVHSFNLIRKGRRIPEHHWLASLGKLVKVMCSEEICIKKQRKRVS